MFNLDRGVFHLREFPLVTDVFSSKRLFERMPSNPLSILNVSIMLLLHIYELAYERTAYWNRIERHGNASASKLRCMIASFTRVRKGAAILFKQF